VAMSPLTAIKRVKVDKPGKFYPKNNPKKKMHLREN
jgi:hypothetical protein